MSVVDRSTVFSSPLDIVIVPTHKTFMLLSHN